MGTFGTLQRYVKPSFKTIKTNWGFQISFGILNLKLKKSNKNEAVMEDRANKLLVKAAQKLNQANQELYKPEEDIVSFLVCKNSQFAIENYLKGYLLKNGIEPSELKTIESLYKECVKINKAFKKVDLTQFDCKIHRTELRYCNEVSKVSHCFDVANSLDTLLREQKVI
ncbi:MAG TPA: HEPN domain-containing protein [Mariniflexile sp.]|nr:HEPN domain-containing protein [Mariniflexile sp.]